MINASCEFRTAPTEGAKLATRAMRAVLPLSGENVRFLGLSTTLFSPISELQWALVGGGHAQRPRKATLWQPDLLVAWEHASPAA